MINVWSVILTTRLQYFIEPISLVHVILRNIRLNYMFCRLFIQLRCLVNFENLAIYGQSSVYKEYSGFQSALQIYMLNAIIQLGIQ